MKVLLDDTWFYFEFVLHDGTKKDFKVPSHFDYYDVIEVLLTNAQYKKHVESETSRTFHVSEKRLRAGLKLINEINSEEHREKERQRQRQNNHRSPFGPGA